MSENDAAICWRCGGHSVWRIVIEGQGTRYACSHHVMDLLKNVTKNLYIQMVRM